MLFTSRKKALESVPVRITLPFRYWIPSDFH